jgi:hypothetical protein
MRTGLQAVAEARATLRMLYKRDLLAVLAWRTAAGPAHGGSSGSSSSRDRPVGAQAQSSQQRKQSKPLPPNRLYQLLLWACDPADPLRGWRHVQGGTQRRQGAARQVLQQLQVLRSEQEEQLRRLQREQQARSIRPMWPPPPDAAEGPTGSSSDGGAGDAG